VIRIFRLDIEIKPHDIDAMGHINNVSYVKWMQAAAVAHSAANGWDLKRYQELGAAWVAREHHIEYRQAGFQSDQLTIETWVAGMKRVSSTRRYKFVREKEDSPIAVAETKWAFVDLQKFRPRKISSVVSDCFEIIDEH
jgi:acyl-CoA thioester hydrolase